MRQALEGSQAIARAVALCRPNVVSAYPITPQTHIVENIAKLVADGELKCEYVSVESEHSAASVALGAAAAGARAYTASASQGILLMCEVLYDIAGLRIPMVLTCANRAVSAPLSIWNDHQDSMAVRDAGWIQLYCADNQEAVDTTIQAFRIAQDTDLPVMVCVDGFTLTHTLEPIELPTQQQVDGFLPPFVFARALDPRKPLSVGTLATPEWFTEARHSHHGAVLAATDAIVAADRDWQQLSGRGCGGLLQVDGPDDARIGIICMGSVVGTLQDAREAMPELPSARIIRLRSFRPFPAQALREACSGLDQVVVLERAISPGAMGIVGAEVRAALYGVANAPRVQSVAAGLGGRDMPLTIYARLLELSQAAATTDFAILDVELDKLPMEDRYAEAAVAASAGDTA
jgi:pyruvate ferredoxin oxidoreductase alpha subunit